MISFEDDFFERRRFNIDNKRIKRIDELTKKLNELSYLLQDANAYLAELEYHGKIGSINWLLTMGYFNVIKEDMIEYSKELNKILLEY